MWPDMIPKAALAIKYTGSGGFFAPAGGFNIANVQFAGSPLAVKVTLAHPMASADYVVNVPNVLVTTAGTSTGTGIYATAVNIIDASNFFIVFSTGVGLGGPGFADPTAPGNWWWLYLTVFGKQ